VVPVDLFGQMAALEQVASRLPDLPVIEDAAQSIGARRKIEIQAANSKLLYLARHACIPLC